MTDYAAKVRSTDAQLRRSGLLIRLTSKTKGVYANGAVPITTTQVNVWGIDTAVSARDHGTTTQSGTLVAAGDRKLMISALDEFGAAMPEPKHGDTAQVGTKVYTVRNVDPLTPGGIVVLYNLVVGA